ncbi:hypothetical protein D3C78_1905610 [compost metagenome]
MSNPSGVLSGQSNGKVPEFRVYSNQAMNSWASPSSNSQLSVTMSGVFLNRTRSIDCPLCSSVLMEGLTWLNP